MRLPLFPLAVMVAAASLIGSSAARADGGGEFVNTFNKCCPPWEKHHFEGAPKICFKPGCPKPICPCDSYQHFGYYQTCWAHWPFPPQFGHCLVPPPGAQVPPSFGRPPVMPETRDTLPNVEPGPKPRKLRGEADNYNE